MAGDRLSENKTRLPGMLSVEDLGDFVHHDQVRTVIVAFTDHFGRLLGKRFEAEIFLKSVCEHGTHACDYLLANDMEMTPVSGYRFANWERGYGDFHLAPDRNTLRLASWLEGRQETGFNSPTTRIRSTIVRIHRQLFPPVPVLSNCCKSNSLIQAAATTSSISAPPSISATPRRILPR